METAHDTPEFSTGCPECARLRKRIEELEALVRELLQRLNRNSSNSSIPPSANPLNAPKRPPRKPSGRKRGGQPGHRGHFRQQVPAERVDEVVEYVPETCSECRADLPRQASPEDPAPRRHQVAELPPLAAVVTEHQAHSRTCPCCGKVNRAEIPPGVLAHTIGPRLAATMSCFSGVYRLSRRSIEEILETVFGVPASLGSIMALEMQTSAAIASHFESAEAEIRGAPVKNVDETGWRMGKAKRWLWTAANSTAAVFRISGSRGRAGLEALLGDRIEGVVVSDRWSAYSGVDLDRRQVCWAHLMRDFQKILDRGGPGAAIGRSGLEVAECLFADWWEFRDGKIDRERLISRIDRIRDEFESELKLGCRSPDKKAARFCRRLLKIYPALWRFSRVEGVEPTNNHGERILRHGVMWRKTSFGNQSHCGATFTERILTVVQTARLQGLSPLEIVCEAIVDYRAARFA